MTAKRTRTVGILLVALSLVGLVVSLPQLVERLDNREDLKGQPVFWFGSRASTYSFDYLGIPVDMKVVRQEATEGFVANEAGALPGYIEITFHDEPAVRLPINTGADDPRLGGFASHQRWFAIMPMAEAKVNSTNELSKRIAQGEVMPQLIAVARYSPEGYNPDSWGSVRRDDWPYRFVRFDPTKPAGERVTVTQATYGELEAFYYPGPYDDAPDIDPNDPEARWAGYWRHVAMVHVTPEELYRAKDRQTQEAWRAMGPWWPAAILSGFALVMGLGFIGASRVSAPDMGLGDAPTA